MSSLYNMARVLTATTGTGTITLGAAVAGFLTFALAGVADGKIVSYTIVEGNNREMGYGVYTASGTTMTRNPRASTNSNAAITLAGGAQVFITPMADDFQPKGHIRGLITSIDATDATNDIGIATGEARDDTDSLTMKLTGALIKRLDANWVVGTNQGMLDTGTVGNNTYFLFLIERLDTGVIDVLASLSLASPTMPSNYTVKRLIGFVVRQAAANRLFLQNGNTWTWDLPVVDINANTTGTTAVTRTLTVPIGVAVIAELLAGGTNGTSNWQGLLSALERTDVAPAGQYNMESFFSVQAGTQNHVNRVSVKTNTSGQIRSRLSASGAINTLFIVTLGFTFAREEN